MNPSPLPQETLRRKRDGEMLSGNEIRALVDGIAQGHLSDAQLGAFAMAVRLRGMDTAETVALTLAMRDSGEQLRWPASVLGGSGPVVDKHSTGGIGDMVSLVLGPLLAACGCFVPMVSGRGLGHTGGTLDKLEAIPGYTVLPGLARLQQVVREAGVAIVGAGPGLARADQRLYAVRDVTATVDSLPLITASILSKKLAAGLQCLVLDVKFGNGAFLPALADAQALARSLVDVAEGAGLPAQALLTDMNQPLAPAAGNAIETLLAIEMLCGRPLSATPAGLASAQAEARTREVVMALGAALLQQAGRAGSGYEAHRLLDTAWRSGAAAERFARMVHGLGGPADLLEQPRRHLAEAAVLRPVPVPDSARDRPQISHIDAVALGMVVVRLGGGRQRPGDAIDPAVGLSRLAPLGVRPAPSAPLAWVHAATEADADAAIRAVQAAYRWSEADVPANGIGPCVWPGVVGSAGCSPGAAA